MHQRNDGHQPPNPEIKAEILVFPLEHQMGSNFDSGHGDEDRVLIFDTDQAVQLLAKSGEW